MPRTVKKKAPARRNDYRNVVEFPRARPRGSSVPVRIPDGIDGDSTGMLIVRTREAGRYGLHDGDMALYDKSLVPKLGDVCVVVDEYDEFAIRRYFELLPTDELRGVVWGFQRQLDRG